ncbi:MAG: BLUF domain-containing protein [Shewanella sp.]
MKLKQFIYSSTAVGHITKADIDHIIEKASKNNAELGITGVLLFNKGTFLQVLEGDEGAINKLRQLIKGDPLHTDFNELCYLHIDKREFPEWAMAHKDANDPDILERFMHMQNINQSSPAGTTMAQYMLSFVANS